MFDNAEAISAFAAYSTVNKQNGYLINKRKKESPKTKSKRQKLDSKKEDYKEGIERKNTKSPKEKISVDEIKDHTEKKDRTKQKSKRDKITKEKNIHDNVVNMNIEVGINKNKHHENDNSMNSPRRTEVPEIIEPVQNGTDYTKKKCKNEVKPKRDCGAKNKKKINHVENTSDDRKNDHSSNKKLEDKRVTKNDVDVTLKTEIFKTPDIESYRQKTKNIKSKRVKIMYPRSRENNPFLKKKTTAYFPVDNYNSVKTGEKMFSWILNPLKVKEFFKDNWEKLPIIIERKCPKYYSHLLSCEEIDTALRKQQLFFTKNIDITSFDAESGIRETHNPPGRATAPQVWDFYANGCSIRILNPQTFFPKIHALLAALQEYFECFVGANVYLTPADSQGFAPHFDDIEAFVIQIEGEKLWKIYAPRDHSEVLPRFSSGNFKTSEIGEPIQEVLLKAGDMMYFPRGFIHQGVALENTHSLHITLSVYQKKSWADLLETLLPAALKSAIEEDVSFREGLPMHTLSHVGLVHSDKTSEIRTQFMEKLQSLMTKLSDYAPVDAAVDQLGKKFIHDCLPPYLRSDEKETTVFEDGEKIRNGVVNSQAEMCLGTRIKLIRYNCIRMLREEDTIRIYYSISNSKEYHAEEPQFLEIDEEIAPLVDTLISSYPRYVAVEDLPGEDDIMKVRIASDLWEAGILRTESPISYMSD